MISSLNFFNKKILYFILAIVTSAAGGHAFAGQEVSSGVAAADFRLAVLPVNNLCGMNAPLRDIQRSLSTRLRALGVSVIADDAVEGFLLHHRIRYTGGVDEKTAKALKEEIKADGVLISSLELYLSDTPPKIAMTTRLVTTSPLEIRWVESVGLSGDDSPGILDLGLINDPKKLQENALSRLMDSFRDFFSVQGGIIRKSGADRAFRPKIAFVSPDLEKIRSRSVAIIPFRGERTRRHSGELAQLHLIGQLFGTGGIRIIEPGIIRENMLINRIIIPIGVSYRDLDIIGIPLNADIIVAGNIFDYLDYSGPLSVPKCDFSIMLLGVKDREILAASNSYNAGDEKVFFFNVGGVSTASALLDKMMLAAKVKIFGTR
jgi:hypothetical protein